MYLREEHKVWLAKGNDRVCLSPKMANRHGLIAGATGTGKTITLKVMAESFSDMGVPVFLADIKGDLSGMCKAGEQNENVQKRIDQMGIEGFAFQEYPTRFFDVFGKKGLPVRTTISEMGPDLIARLLDLNDTQTGILTIIFKIADDQGLLLLDLKDLKSMVRYVGDNNSEFRTEYGNISTQSIGSIQRALLRLEEQGGDIFFGEPALDIFDWMGTDQNGRGYMNILECDELFQQPLLYSTFMLWMLSELYENLPEAGDLEKPKMIFFFDEAHLLFDDAPKALLQKVEQVVRLIRSKGLGVYFITQMPSDVPENVLAQLGNKVQHALRAYTPNEQKAIKAAARSFRANPAFDCEQVLTELGTGEALVSVLDEDGVPTMAERAMILPPMSHMGMVDESVRDAVIKSGPLYDRYNRGIDRDSAYEYLERKLKQEAVEEVEAQKKEVKVSGSGNSSGKGRSGTKKSATEKMADTALRTVSREVTRSLTRGLLGSLKKLL